MEVFDDLAAEEDRLEAILSDLDESEWRAPSAAAGWTVGEVVLHLAQTEEAALATTRSDVIGLGPASRNLSVDAEMDRLVKAERSESAVVFERWRIARRAALAALREADPERALQWVAGPIRPKTLATTRLAEHWAHGLDITESLRIAFPDTTRLWHVAWLAHRSLPYAFALAGEDPHDVFCELAAPDGGAWRFGRRDAEGSISGTAVAFCRVAEHRLAPGDSGLVAHGPYSAVALRILRNYAE